MNENLKALEEKRIERTIENLKRNNMEAFYAKTKEEALTLATSFLTQGETIACGGSATLDEVGISKYLLDNKDNYNYLYRDPNYTQEQTFEILRKGVLSDTYFTSSNAVTEDGKLVNIDGNGNRVASMIFGPKKVIVVVGVNKITKDTDSAYNRIKEISAPANAIRLKRDTPCAKVGKCMDCKSPDRICCEVVVHQQQRVKGRIHVIIVGENLGF